MSGYLKRRRGRRRRPLGCRTDPTYAALDLGTNNCRLLIACRQGDGGFEVVDAFSRIVRLGEGLTHEGRLSERAMRRTVDALRVCSVKMHRAGVVRSRSVATEACRQAENCDAFIARAARDAGVTIETIATAEEVRLVVQGCLPLIAASPPWGLLFDIGGGSTEVVWLSCGSGGPRVVDWISLPLGVVTLSERPGAAEMTAPAYQALIEEIRGRLAPFCARHGIAAAVARGEVQMIGTSGTVTTLAGLRLGLRRYERSLVDGTMLDFDAIARISAALRESDCASRAANPCIGADRADLVVAGCAVLEAICCCWPIGRLRVADRGIREGILIELMREPVESQPRLPSVTPALEHAAK